LTEAIWPAKWPALVMTALLWWLGRALPPRNLIGVGLQLALGGLVYVGLFLGLAIRGEERDFYWMKLRGLVVRQWRAPAAA
jgi:hypothetical protein